MTVLMILCGHQRSFSSGPPNADRLAVQGQIALKEGDYQQAIALFQQAETLYEEDGNDEGVIGTQVNQGIALKEVGRQHRACKQLSKAINVSGVCDVHGLEDISVEHSLENEPGMLGLQALASLLIDMSYLEDASAVIERLTALAPHASTTLLAQLMLKNAEIEIMLNRQTLSMTAIEPAVLAQIQQTMREGARLLRQLLDTPPSILLPAIIHTLKTEALMDQVGIPIEQTHNADLQAYLTPEQFQRLGHNRFKALAVAIDGLITLDGNQQQIMGLLENAEQSVVRPQERAQLAFLQGEFLDHQTQDNPNDNPKIESLYQQAATLATLSHHPILAYTSYHRLALIQNNTPEQKITLFKQAIAQLEQAKTTLAITPRLLPKLEYDIQSIFHDYMDALIEQGQPISSAHSTMKRWRIDAYLSCSNSTIEDESSPKEADIIYITVLENTIVTTVKKDRTERQYFADKEPALEAIHRLLHELEPRNATPDLTAFKTASQQTYSRLLKAAIDDHFIVGDTLQFNLDPALETLPIAAFFNEERERFLIEDFPIIYRTDLNDLSTNQRSFYSPIAFIGSMSIQNPNHDYSLRFPPLPEVDFEARTIESMLKPVYRLNNENFTLENIKDALQEWQPSIVHIATHGLFSANPRDTALLTWDKPIHPQTLGHLLGKTPLHLLVFSSCETAKGGRLGIAGVALQSGAQNTIATISIVDSRATHILMAKLYEYLKEGQSIEQSLRMAQQILLKSSLFNHPLYWSSFILFRA